MSYYTRQYSDGETPSFISDNIGDEPDVPQPADPPKPPAKPEPVPWHKNPVVWIAIISLLVAIIALIMYMRNRKFDF